MCLGGGGFWDRQWDGAGKQPDTEIEKDEKRQIYLEKDAAGEGEKRTRQTEAEPAGLREMTGRRRERLRVTGRQRDTQGGTLRQRARA